MHFLSSRHAPFLQALFTERMLADVGRPQFSSLGSRTDVSLSLTAHTSRTAGSSPSGAPCSSARPSAAGSPDTHTDALASLASASPSLHAKSPAGSCPARLHSQLFTVSVYHRQMEKSSTILLICRRGVSSDGSRPGSSCCRQKTSRSGMLRRWCPRDWCRYTLSLRRKSQERTVHPR